MDFLSLLYVSLSWGMGLLLYLVDREWKIPLLLTLPFLLYFHFRWQRRSIYLLIAALILIAGFGYAAWEERSHPSTLSSILPPDRPVSGYAWGRIDSSPVVDGDAFRFILRLDHLQLGEEMKVEERIWVRYRLASEQEKRIAETLMRGDRIGTPLTFQLPEAPRNPGAFDFPQYLRQIHITWTGTEEGLSQFRLLEKGPLLGWRGIEEIRSALAERVDLLFSPEIAGVMKGMLLGSMEEIPADLTDRYRETGLIHVLAISGFHVMVVIAGLLSLFHLLGLTRERSYEILLLFIPLYVLVTGAAPSVVRAGMMGFLYILAKRLHQPYSGVKAISIAFLIMSLIDPRQLMGLGFQLSFLVSFFLLLFTTPLAERMRSRYPRLPEGIAVAVSVLLLAQIASFPLLLQATHTVSMIPIIANFLWVPLFTLFIPWGYLALLLSLFFPLIARYVAIPLEGALQFLHTTLRLLSNEIGFYFSFATPPLWAWTFYLLFLFFFTSAFVEWSEGKVAIGARRRRWFLPLSLTFLLLFLLLPPFLHRMDPSFRITFIDVGQGDAILIQSPDGKNILVDGGGEPFVPEEPWRKRMNPFHVGKDLLLPTLRALGVSRLHWVILTHGDLDHIGGLDEVITSLPVDRLLGNGLMPTTKVETDFWQLAKEKRIPMYRAGPGMGIPLGEKGRMMILGPEEAAGEASGENNASILLLVQAYGKQLLLTGDLEAEGERNLIARSPFTVDVLKVGHHGSKSSTSEAFLEEIKPKLAIISVGAKNRFGHPSREVLARLEEHRVPTFRTDHLGAITVRINPGQGVKVFSFMKGGSKKPIFTIE